MITGLAHTGVCVPDVEAAADMGELIPEPRPKAAILGFTHDGDRVRTTWFTDPWGVVFILVEKSRPERPHFAQWG